jgi:hypothetical protein
MTSERVTVSRLTKPADQHIITSVKEDDSRRHADRCRATPHRLNRMTRISVARIEDEADTSETLRILPDLLNECGEELIWEVIDRAEANIFE